jgi:hypothetical protein
MATFAAVAATTAALQKLLEAAATTEPDLETAHFLWLRSEDLQSSPPDQLAVSLYLYHVAINPTRRTAPERWTVDGQRRPGILPLDLHYLMTAWARDAETQQRLLGWAVSVIQDTPTLSAGLLNSTQPTPVFRPDETVEVIWETLTPRDLYDIWDVARRQQQPSAAYVVRVVEIESTLTDEHALVQTREQRYGRVPV